MMTFSQALASSLALVKLRRTREAMVSKNFSISTTRLVVSRVAVPNCL